MSNYPEHFGLKQRVFKREQQAFVYVTDQMREAEREFRTAFDESDCVVTVSGPIGSGKTTVVNHALDSLPGKTRVIRLGRVRLAPDEILELLLTELGVAEPPNGTIRKLGALGDNVSRLKSDETRLVVVVEDAGRTGVDTLAELEVICGSDGGFDIGLVVCGDETLPKLLKDERLRRLAQRVAAGILVAPLAVDEMEDYLLSAIRGAGGDPSRILSNDVPALLHILSCGVPRLANKLVEAALKKVAAQSGPRVTCSLLADIAEAQFGITTEIPVKRRPPAGSAKFTTSQPGASARPPKDRTATDPTARRADAAAHDDVPVTGAVDKPDPVAAPGDEPRAQQEPASTAPKTAPPAAAALPEPTKVDTSEPTAPVTHGDAADDDLPYLIQDTQPELVALNPESLGDDPSVASSPGHEMLPDLDELAAELAASNPAPVAAAELAELPELDDIPELPVETRADATPQPAPVAEAPPPRERTDTPETVNAANLAVDDTRQEPAGPDGAAAAREPEPQAIKAEPKMPELKADPELPEIGAEPALPVVGAEPDVPGLQADSNLPDIEAAPNPPAAKDETPSIAAKADPELPDIQVTSDVPELAIETAPPPEVQADLAEATPDEAALISALAEEHATSQPENVPRKSVGETPHEAVDTTRSPASPAADAVQATIDGTGDDTKTGKQSPASASAAANADAPAKAAKVMPEPRLETVAAVNEQAANADQDPSLKLEVLDDDETEDRVDDGPKQDEVVIRDADRDPTLAQLKPDLDALELALAENFVPESAQKKGDGKESAVAEPMPQITLDNSIDEKVSAEAEDLARREAEIAARKKAAEEKSGPKRKPGPSDTDVHKLAAELQRTTTLEDMDDKLAETLFGDEINMVASQVLKAAREQAESATAVDAQEPAKPAPVPAADDADVRKQFEDVWGQVPDESEAIDLKSVKPNSGLDMSASQRLATVRALNAGMGTPPPPAAKKKPGKPKEAPVPIEDQIDISMTNTMKALNIDPKVLEQPSDAEEAPKGGFFSRFRKKG